MTRDDQARRRTILQAAEELRGDEPAPGVEELVEFATGKSSTEEAERVRDQVTFEEAPRRMVLDLVALQRGEEGGELSDQEVEDDWQALMTRVEEEPAGGNAEPGPPPRRVGRAQLADLQRPRASRRRWRQTVSDVLAASFLLTTIGLGYQVLTTDETQTFSETHHLRLQIEGLNRSEPANEESGWIPIEAGESEVAFSFEIDVSHHRWTDLKIEFFEETGERVKSVSMRAPHDPRDTPKLVFPRDDLPAGRYRIVVSGHDGGLREGVTLGEYRIRFRHAGDPSR